MLNFPRWKLLSILGVCLFFILSALPNLGVTKWESYPGWLPQQNINLGLDLRGGSHLLLQVDFDAYLAEQFESLRDEMRIALRKAHIGYRSLIATSGSVGFTIRPETLEEGPSVADIIHDIDPELEVAEVQENEFVVTYSPMALVNRKQQLLEQSIQIIQRRIDETGTREPTIQRQGEDRVLVQVPGMENPEQLKGLLGKTAKMTFHLVNEAVTPEQISRGIVPPGTRILPSDDASERFSNGTAMRYAIQSQVALSGDLLTGANASYSQGRPVVDFSFNPLGARKFGEITQDNVGRRFAVVLDGKVITAPVIRSAILGGKGIIEGNFTAQSANELAILLRAGALPAPMKIIEERSVGPSLGADSIAAGERAGVIGILAVMAFMLLSYGLFGVFANFALILNIAIILGAMSLLQATLTMPGIAGIVLTMGMAVDANTLIYERIREELALGRSVISAIETGFKAAYVTILDSNLTTLIAAALLFYFGSGTVKGFAVTLAFGIMSSMFTAVLVTRLMVATWVRRRRPKALKL